MKKKERKKEGGGGGEGEGIKITPEPQVSRLFLKENLNSIFPHQECHIQDSLGWKTLPGTQGSYLQSFIKIDSTI